MSGQVLERFVAPVSVFVVERFVQPVSVRVKWFVRPVSVKFAEWLSVQVVEVFVSPIPVKVGERFVLAGTCEYRRPVKCRRVRPSIMQDFFWFRNGLFLPLLFVTSFLNFLVRVQNLMRDSV